MTGVHGFWQYVVCCVHSPSCSRNIQQLLVENIRVISHDQAAGLNPPGCVTSQDLQLCCARGFSYKEMKKHAINITTKYGMLLTKIGMFSTQFTILINIL